MARQQSTDCPGEFHVLDILADDLAIIPIEALGHMNKARDRRPKGLIYRA
jgi:hypothetical protein